MLGLAIAAGAAAVVAVAVGGSSKRVALPAELRGIDVAPAHARPALMPSLARAGANAVLVDAPAADLTAAAKSAHLLVLSRVRARGGAAAADACRDVRGVCAVEVRTPADAVRAAATRGVDVAVVRLTALRQLRVLTDAARTGRILAVLGGSADWHGALGLAAASPVVDLAVAPASAARLRASTAAPRPRPPAGVRVSGAARASLSMAWRARPGTAPVAYRLSRNRIAVAATTSTSVQLTGLDCGQPYTVGVQAVDADGRLSRPVAVNARTVTCPLRVSMSGSDSSNCSQALPCLSFDRAYHSAAPGQVIEVDGGTYPEQTMLYDEKKAGTKRDHVVFQPAAGATVKINGDVNISDNRRIKGASHVTFRRLTVLGNINLEGCGVPDGDACPPQATAGSSDLTFDHLRVKGPVALLCHSCDHIRILGGIWGPDTYLPCHGALHPEVSPTYDPTTFVKLKRPNHILIDGARFQNFARCSGSDHTECLQFEPADYVTIRNSVFTRCDTITLAFFTSLAGDSKSPAGYAAPDHVVLENNFIDQSYDATGGPTYNSLQIGECTNCLIRNNSWLQNAHLPANPPVGEISRHNRVVGNAGMQSDCGNGGIVFSHNVFVGAKCGPTDKRVAGIGFVDPKRMNLRLLPGSPAIDAGDPHDFEPRDIYGTRRPVGRAPDAGAVEWRKR